MLLAGFITPTSIHITHSYERNFLNELFKKLDKFIQENVCDSQKYQIFFNTFYECAEEIKYLSEIGREYGRLQIGLVELPYSLEEKQLSNEYYDNLPIDAEPIWMRNGLLSA